jgi:hypothetical protein
VQRHLSAPRLAPYVAACAGDLGRGVALYRWNASVSAALWEIMGHGEIILRNAIHDALSERHRRDRAPGEWFDDARRELEPRALADVAVARHRASRTTPDPPPGKVVAELSFGFWRYLLARRYTPTLWPAIRHSFPHLPRGGRNDLENAVIRLHLLRNRIAHHEPLIRENLTARLSDLTFVLDAVNPAIGAWALDDGGRLAGILAANP